jgi:four helix bundle protein
MRRKHKDLALWNEAIELVAQIYRFAASLPSSEQFGLRSQMQRAAVSIPSNIAEGASRQSTKELIQFVSIAIGSASELDAQLEICAKLGYGTDADLQTRLDQVSVALSALRHSLKSKLKP